MSGVSCVPTLALHVTHFCCVFCFCHTGDRSQRTRLLRAAAPPEDYRGGTAGGSFAGGVEGNGALGRGARQEGKYALYTVPPTRLAIVAVSCFLRAVYRDAPDLRRTEGSTDAFGAFLFCFRV